MTDASRLLERFSGRAGVNDNTLVEAEQQLGASLPAEYAEFLRLTNGGEGFVGNAYAILWRADELDALNRAYEVHEYAPGLLIFGSDGGGEAFGFDTRQPTWPIVEIPFVGMDWSLARPLAASFNSFLQVLGGRYR